jgi:hypothetical protein
MIRVDLDTLLGGVPTEGELCEIIGFGPIPVSVVEELIANDNTFIVGVLTRSHQIQGVFHQRRHPNAHQKSALDFLYPACAASARRRIGKTKTRRRRFSMPGNCRHHHVNLARQGSAAASSSFKLSCGGHWGCSARAGLQSDHRLDWIKSRFTVFDLLDRLCPHHHKLKTNNNWALVEGTGKRDFVPPGDPRHPGYAPAATGMPP